ncbi:MAG: hypothetical protein ACI9BO_001821 [Zhongshania sp.]|jgi:hypothetical protein
MEFIIERGSAHVFSQVGRRSPPELMRRAGSTEQHLGRQLKLMPQSFRQTPPAPSIPRTINHEGGLGEKLLPIHNRIDHQ